VRERAIDALGKTRDPHAVEPLVALLSRHERTAPLCAKALAAIGDARAIAPMVRLYESGPAEMRAETLEALKAFPLSHLGPTEKSFPRPAPPKAPWGNGPVISAEPSVLEIPPTLAPRRAPPVAPVSSTPAPPASRTLLPPLPPPVTPVVSARLVR